MATPVFEVGDYVVRGETGKVIHKVIAVIASGRIVTYDLRTVGTERTFIGVPQPRLFRAQLPAPAACSACGTSSEQAPHHVDYVREHGVCVV